MEKKLYFGRIKSRKISKFKENNFILGDIHWNKDGTIKILEGLNKRGIFNEISSLE